MRIPFVKYHGTGNDFILIDGRRLSGPLGQQGIAGICHRHFGIGADGLIVVNPSTSEGVDYEMVYYNADGREGSMCGNGARCAFHFAQALNLASSDVQFLAYDGMHSAKSQHGLIAVSLRDVSSVVQKEVDSYILDTGSPHYVRFVEDIHAVDVFVEGRAIRNSSGFIREGINVNFAQIIQDGIRVRTYERGVEDITMSCGTGVTAVALAYAERNTLSRGPVHIISDGGRLAVEFDREGSMYNNITLLGPVLRVFEGTIDTDLLALPNS